MMSSLAKSMGPRGDQWKTKDGTMLKLSDMDNSHLINCYRKFHYDDDVRENFKREIESRGCMVPKIEVPFDGYSKTTLTHQDVLSGLIEAMSFYIQVSEENEYTDAIIDRLTEIKKYVDAGNPYVPRITTFKSSSAIEPSDYWMF